MNTKSAESYLPDYIGSIGNSIQNELMGCSILAAMVSYKTHCHCLCEMAYVFIRETVHVNHSPGTDRKNLQTTLSVIKSVVMLVVVIPRVPLQHKHIGMSQMLEIK